MYLLERLLGISLYSTVLFLIILCIYRTKKIGRILEVYAIILSVMAFFYKPAETADLFRIYEAMEYFSDMSWDSFYNNLLITSTPAYLIYIRIIGKIGIKELLPAITAFLYYINVFYILKKSSQKYGINNKLVALVLFFFMTFGQFLQVISGIRSMLAFSIVTRCMYEEIIENKNFVFNLLKYIFAFCLHPVGVVSFVIRIFYEIFFLKAKKYSQLIRKFIVLLIVSVIGIKIAIPYILGMIHTIKIYLEPGGYSYIWEYILAVFHLILIIYSLYKYKYYLRKNRKINSLVKLIKFLITVVCLLFFEYSTFQRFTVFVSGLFLPVFVYILSIVQQDILKNKNYIKTMICGSVLILLLACLRGNLSAYKFFIL